ncbi:proline-specific peptidase [Trametes polyzona]|nr:proline-specific peptidase [Trametes polyzona]
MSVAREKVPTTEGSAPFTYKGEAYETYYKVFGDLQNCTHTPVIGLHGGPGLVHQAIAPLAHLAESRDIPVILYDQLGNGRSTHVRGKPADFWTIDLFVAELENLIAHLGIQDSFDLVGHSWGGVLGLEFELRKQPAGLRRLVLADSLPSFELWMQSVGQLLQAFPAEVQQGIVGGMADPKRYREALRALHAKHGCIVQPTPADYEYALDATLGESGDPTVAQAPILVGWSAIDRLHLVRVPTLLINGRKDIAQDFVVQPFFQHIPKVKWVTFGNSSHTPFFEEPERFLQVVADFLGFDG